MKQPIKNLIVLNIDASGSMGGLREGVIKLFNSQVEFLAERSKKMEQETRIFVYRFSDDVENLVWDTDVLRTPDISKLYKPNGCTALIDSTLKSIEDILLIPQLYCDVSVLHYTISDGLNNISGWKSRTLEETIQRLPENWTMAFLAPDDRAAQEAEGFGWRNIQKWNVSLKGVEEMSRKLSEVTGSFMEARSKGAKSAKSNLFSLNVDSLKVGTVKKNLDELSPSEYDIIPVRVKGDGMEIRDYFEYFFKSKRLTYVKGSGYYQLTKREIIQSNKNILVQNKKTGKVYGGDNARQMLGLPDHEVRVAADFNKDFLIFVQSNSVNRHLVKNTDLIILK